LKLGQLSKSSHEQDDATKFSEWEKDENCALTSEK